MPTTRQETINDLKKRLLTAECVIKKHKYVKHPTFTEYEKLLAENSEAKKLNEGLAKEIFKRDDEIKSLKDRLEVLKNGYADIVEGFDEKLMARSLAKDDEIESLKKEVQMGQSSHDATFYDAEKLQKEHKELKEDLAREVCSSIAKSKKIEDIKEAANLSEVWSAKKSKEIAKLEKNLRDLTENK